MFRNFLAFSIFLDVNIHNISPPHILAFMEFLVFNKVSTSQISNYLSAIKVKFALFALNTTPFFDPRIKYYTKALARQAPLTIRLKTIIDIPLLTRIIQQCQNLYMGYVFQAAFLLAFFAFFRISNLVPHTTSAYDPLKQLARADIFFTPTGASILLKWSKTLQMNNSVRLIKIPLLGSSPLCPVRVLRKLLSLTPTEPNNPLFQIKCFGKWVPLTDTRLRKTLTSILHNLNLANSNITFHSFRR